MSYNPYDLGGALARGIATGAVVGEGLGNRWLQHKTNSGAKKAAKIQEQLAGMGVLDDEGNVSADYANDAEIQGLVAERNKYIGGFHDSVQNLNSRGAGGDAYANASLARYAPKNMGIPAPAAPAQGAPGTSLDEAAAAVAGADTQDLDTIEVKPFKEGAALADPYENQRRALDWRKQISAVSGHAYDSPEVREKVGSAAAAHVYGQIQDNIQRLASGEYNQTDVDRVAGGLRTLSLHHPALKGANIYVIPSAKAFAFDFPGEEDDTEIRQIPFSAMGEAQTYFEQAMAGPSTALPNIMASKSAEAERRSTALVEDTKQKYAVAIELFKDNPAAKQVVIADATLKSAGIESGAVTPDEIAALNASEDAGGLLPGVEFRTKAKLGDGGTYYVGRRALQSASGEPVYETVYVDAARGKEVPEAEFTAAVEAFRKGAGSSVTSAFNMQAQARADQYKMAMDVLNTATAQSAGGNFMMLQGQRAAPAAAVPAPGPAASGGPTASTGAPSAGFEAALSNMWGTEGGLNMSDQTTGMPVNFGIDQKANPDIDVPNLTREGAAQIYKERYWDKYDIGSLPPAMQEMAFDAVVNQGNIGKKLIDAAGGDVNKLAQLRKAEYQRLAQADPEKYGPSLKSWLRRVDERLARANAGAQDAGSRLAAIAPPQARAPMTVAQVGDDAPDESNTPMRVAMRADGGVMLSPDYFNRIRQG